MTCHNFCGGLLEQEGVRIRQQFESLPPGANQGEIEILLSAMQTGQKLQKIVEDGRPLEEYPALSPLTTLRTILETIHERNRLANSGLEDTVALTPDGQQIAVALPRGTVQLWNWQGQLLFEWEAHSHGIPSLAFSPDGQYLATASDQKVRLWNKQGQLQQELKYPDQLSNLAFSPNGQYLATGSKKGTVWLWDAQGTLLRRWEAHPIPKGLPRITNRLIDNSLAFSPDGKKLVTATPNDNIVRLWDTQGNLLTELEHSSRVASVAFSPDGQRLATALVGGKVRLWDTQGHLDLEWNTYSPRGTKVVFSPDGKYLATASWEGEAKLWDTQGNLLREFEVDQSTHSSFSSIVFSPDGEHLAAASAQNNLMLLWNKQGKLLAQMRHQGLVTSVDFSPDEQQLVTVSRGKAWLWNRQGLLLAELKVNSDWIESAAFSSDGHKLLTVSNKGTLRLWKVEKLDELLVRGCDWLNDYLVFRLQVLETLSPCQKPSRLMAAAPFLVKKGERLAKGGKFDSAVATFRKALEWNPNLDINPKAKAVPALIVQGERLAREGNIEGAIIKFQKALKLDPSLDLKPLAKANKLAAPALVTEGNSLIRAGKLKDALAAYTKAQKLDPDLDISADDWNYLCWWGSLHRYAAEVMFACEKAVEPEPEPGRFRASRGIARALTDNIKGAIEDFYSSMDWSNSNEADKDVYTPDQEWNKESKKEWKVRLQTWIDALGNGEKPFNDEELEILRKEYQ